jgi:iron only hydrogenase large subunit-like protein
MRKEKLVAMLAPSFPIVFSYPAIITMLKKLGMSYTAEVAVGATQTNEQLMKLITDHPSGVRYITSPCPTMVRLIRRQLPQYAHYLMPGVDSPMIATAKIVRDRYPGYRPVFIGPCFVKKIEAKEDAPELNILVVTYSELQRVLTHFGVTDSDIRPEDHFDIRASGGLTTLYALDGGLTQSSGAADRLGKTAVKNVSGPQKNMAALKEFDTDTSIRLLDILNCDGGCIMGPGIQSKLTPEERKRKILAYYVQQTLTNDIDAAAPAR